MKRNFVIFILILLIQYISASNKIVYTEPLPGAHYVSLQNNVVIGFENEISLDEKQITKCVNLTGSVSLLHNCKIIITKDRKKIIFIPVAGFLAGEKVTVSISGSLLKIFSGNKKYQYDFFTTLTVNRIQNNNTTENITGYMPPVFPELTVTINNNPENGYLFLSNFSAYPNYTPYLIITDKNGLPYYFKMLNNQAMDFKKQQNGNLTYYNNAAAKFYELGINYNLLDSFYSGNGYKTDAHDLQVLSNRHALLLSNDLQTVDMSQFVPGGDTAASVTGLIIQEIDENKNVVFQWRSWDHFLITDAIHQNMHAHTIDAVHGNAIELDNDGNLLLSSRHLDEITKINRSTGEIIWRLGGTKNQFTFINDTLRFTYQHAVRRISNGNITLYDNGNYHTPQFSRAVEYSLDEVNKTAVLIWEYRHTPSIYGSAMGNVQRLPGGNTLIGWGSVNPTVTEVTPQGTIAFEMTLPQDMHSYRVFKFDWNGSPTSGGQEISKLPASYMLSQNYPNPFNPVTSISFDIPTAGFVNLTVFDVTGREIKKLVSGQKEAGSYSVTFSGENLSSGLYLYRMNAGDYSVTRKMILIK